MRMYGLHWLVMLVHAPIPNNDVNASEVGRSETNWEIVSFGFVRSCGLIASWTLGSNPGAVPFPFLLPSGGFPFPLVGFVIPKESK